MNKVEYEAFSPLEGETRIKIFKALESKTRLRILKLLFEGDKYILELARLLDVSAPFVAKNLKILEDADLITRNVFGNTHVISINKKNAYVGLDIFAIIKEVDSQKENNMLDALMNFTATEAEDTHNKR
ncbi:winged helix-turn-helix domain-containing protein [Methanolobus sp. ZRKC2]|uniref:ArsR/SmtB family transcription factor n=1 Tax=Methanolobus sp. ZRKC2 TaxID=3125783 RepID=UPI00325558AA